jgi:hypothetical protein
VYCETLAPSEFPEHHLPHSRSNNNPMKGIFTGVTLACLVILGIWVVYKKESGQFNRAAGIVEVLADDDQTERWSLPCDDAVVLVKHQNHTNVAEALNAAHMKLRGKRLQIEGTTRGYTREEYLVYPAHNGAVELYGHWYQAKKETEAMEFATELSRELNTLVVVTLIREGVETGPGTGIYVDTGTYAVFENGQRRFWLKRWDQNGLKFEMDGAEWVMQHGYVVDPVRQQIGEWVGGPNELTLKLGIDLSGSPVRPREAFLILRVAASQNSSPQH